MVRLITIQDCIHLGFPYIHESLTGEEPAPQYQEDENGMSDLKKVLDFMRGEYYPTFYDKAAYIITSIACSQYFQNGNKRLAAVVLLLFLITNEVEISDFSISDFKKILLHFFPGAVFEQTKSIPGAHPLFLYNLAIVLGDRSKWDTTDFTELRNKVSGIFRLIYRLAA